MSGDDEEASPAADPGREDQTPARGEAPAEADQKARTVAGDGAASTERDVQDDLATLLAELSGNYYNNTNNFYGQIIASGATFGNASGPAGDETGRRARTGRLSATEATAMCAHFAEPPLFHAAAVALQRDRVVVLAGPADVGKGTSAVRLLLNVGAERLEVVSPDLTLDQLATHDFDVGHWYLLENWQQAPRNDATSDFRWRVLRDHVEDSKAHLVITAPGGTAPRSVAQFAWTAPPASQVLAAYLAGTAAQGAAEQIAGRIPDTYGVGSVASIGQRLAAGEDPSKISEDLANDPGRYVRTWLLAGERTEDEITEVTALSFAVGHSERVFETILKRLRRALRADGLLLDPAEGQLETTDGADAALAGFVPRTAGLAGSRIRRHPGGLLIREFGRVRFPGDEAQYQYLVHRNALQVLWREYDVSFWTGVRRWLTELISDMTIHDVQMSVAVGLTLLAFVAPDEVEDSYLHPWAIGQQAWSGQQTAVYVLSLMSRDDSLAPIALRIATNWVNSGDPVCQWTAAAALSGELGGVYPTPAMSRLWHLVGQWKEVPTKAVIALANLFATLTREGEGQEACQVLEFLRERLDRASRRGDEAGDGQPGRPPASWREDRRNRERAMLCLLDVLAVRDPGTKQPSVTSFLAARPEHLGLVAGLWAAVLRHRPYRKRAVVALLDAVRGFEYVSDAPQAAARSLGDALTEALPEDEHQPLKAAFVNILARAKRPCGDQVATVRALMDAFDHLKPTENTSAE